MGVSFRLVLLSSLLGVKSMVSSATRDPTKTHLNEWPLVMAHDAATTYLEGGLLHQINDWTKTQPDGGPSGMLDCGVRAFDWRPFIAKDGSIQMHHGPITVDHPMADSLDDMISWASAKGNAVEDLIVLVVGHCEGDNCTGAVLQLLQTKNIIFMSDCSQLSGLTVSAAFERAKLSSGGAILGLDGSCHNGNWDPAVACSGFGTTLNEAENTTTPTSDQVLLAMSPNSSREIQAQAGWPYDCYTDSSTKSFPLDRIWAYMQKVLASGTPAAGQMYAVQAIWQETTSSVVVGEARASTLLDDESRSTLNQLVKERVESGALDTARVNMVYLNNVCNGGLELLAALREGPTQL